MPKKLKDLSLDRRLENENLKILIILPSAIPGQAFYHVTSFNGMTKLRLSAWATLSLPSLTLLYFTLTSLVETILSRPTMRIR